jgi:hypothetical protein
MSSPGTPCKPRRELRATVFRRRPIHCRSVGGRSNGSQFSSTNSPSRLHRPIPWVRTIFVMPFSRCAVYTPLVWSSQTFVRFSHASFSKKAPPKRGQQGRQDEARRSRCWREPGALPGISQGVLRRADQRRAVVPPRVQQLLCASCLDFSALDPWMKRKQKRVVYYWGANFSWRDCP